MTNSEKILGKLNRKIDLAYAEHRMDCDVLDLVEARDEIERLNLNYNLTKVELERLFRWINEANGESVEIVKLGDQKSRPEKRAAQVS